MDPTGNGDQLFYIRFHLHFNIYHRNQAFMDRYTYANSSHGWAHGKFFILPTGPKAWRRAPTILSCQGLGEELDVGFRQEDTSIFAGVSFSRPYYSPKTETAGTPKLALWVDVSPFFQPGVFSGEPCLLSGLEGKPMGFQKPGD